MRCEQFACRRWNACSSCSRRTTSIFAAQDWSAFGERLEPLYAAAKRGAIGLQRPRRRDGGGGCRRLGAGARRGAALPAAEGPADLDRARCAADAVGGILALPVADTVKKAAQDEAGTHRIAATEDRAQLWLAQTPQMFRAGLLLQALQRARGEVTDEAARSSRWGSGRELVAGSRENIKVTWPEDVAIAEAHPAAAHMRIGQGFDVHAFAAGRQADDRRRRDPVRQGPATATRTPTCCCTRSATRCSARRRWATSASIFPTPTPRTPGIDSRQLLRDVTKKLGGSGCKVVNIDATIIAAGPAHGAARAAHDRQHRRRSRRRAGGDQHQGHDHGAPGVHRPRPRASPRRPLH